MSLDTEAEDNLLTAIYVLNHALIEVNKIPRPKEREKILKYARAYAAQAGISF